MSLTFRSSPNAHRMLQRIQKEIRATFTPAQVQAIEAALVPCTHVCDVRLSLPLFGRGAYFVLMAGPNRRSKNRSQPNLTDVPKMLADVIDISQTNQSNPNACRMLQRIPTDISVTFTQTQIQAMERALIPKRHLVDVRLSLPLLGKGAYLVFVAGPNRRTHYRDIQNNNPFVMPAVCASILAGGASIFGLVQLNDSRLLEKPDPVFAKGEAFHPTAVPFKKNQQECEESDRQWIDDQCIDTIHDPSF